MIRVAINGFGRIGRNVLRSAKQAGRDDIDFVAVNDLTDPESLAHLLKYDSVHGRFPGDISVSGDRIEAGADMVVASAPFKIKDKGQPMPEDATTTVMGINANDFDPRRHRLVSNASCTTNSLAPVAKLLNEKFGIVKGLMTTIHSYTNDQNILDLPHKDLRRARSAAINQIPTRTTINVNSSSPPSNIARRPFKRTAGCRIYSRLAI